MKITTIYLLISFAAIAVLSVSMMWQFAAFGQSMNKISFSVPSAEKQEFQNIIGQTEDLAKKAINDAANITTGTDEFVSTDKKIKFLHPSPWKQEAGNSQQILSQGKTLFAASKTNMSPLSLIYAIAWETEKTNRDEIISLLEKSQTPQIKIDTAGAKTRQVKNGTIEVFDSLNESNAKPENSLTIMFSRNAVIYFEKNCYIITVIGSQSNIDLIKEEADQIFSTIEIANQPVPAESE